MRARALVALAAPALLAVAATAVAPSAGAAVAPDPATRTTPGWRRPAPVPLRPLAPVAVVRISARFGQVGRHWRLGHHTGLDFVAPIGTPVRAVAAGRVVKLAWNPYWGRMVILEISPGVTVWYCHLSRVLVHPGDVVRGQVLGRVGISGSSTGAHLHLEVRVRDRPTDPAAYEFGAHAGHPGPVPSWYPRVPLSTVAALAPLGSH